jgi:hypothetical protein
LIPTADRLVVADANDFLLYDLVAVVVGAKGLDRVTSRAAVDELAECNPRRLAGRGHQRFIGRGSMEAAPE